MPKMTPNEDRPFAIYARLSRAISGDLDKVDYQVEQCQKYAANRGLPISDDLIFYDNSLSAWKRGVVRPQWDAMMAAAETGAMGGILVWALDRFSRRPRDLETLIELAERHRVVIDGPRSNRLDLTTATGKQQARWMAMQASAESDNTSERVKAAFARKVAKGEPVSGRAFGFESNGQDQDPAAVLAIRQVAERLLKGESLMSMAAWLNDQGYRTNRGHRWNGTKLGRVLRGRRYGGWLEFNGEIVGKIRNSDGSEQDPILDQETYEQVQTLLMSRRRGRRPSGRFWLTGMIECSDCGIGMSGSSVHDQRAYQCHRLLGGCARSILAETVERQVDEHMIEELSDERNAISIAANQARLSSIRTERMADLDRIDDQLVELEVKWATGELIPAAYDRAKPKLMERRSKIVSILDELAPEVAIANFDPQVGWSDLETEERRQLLRFYHQRIQILPWRVLDGETGTRVRFSIMDG